MAAFFLFLLAATVVAAALALKFKSPGVLFTLFCLGLSSCSQPPQGGEISLRSNGNPVFAPAPIKAVQFQGKEIVIELNSEDSAELKRFIQTNFKDGGFVDFYVGQELYLSDLHLRPEFGGDWKILKIPRIQGAEELFAQNHIKVRRW